MAPKLEFDADLFRAASRKSDAVHDKIDAVLTTLKAAIDAKDGCWGDDTLGTNFATGGDGGYTKMKSATTTNAQAMADAMGKFSAGQADAAAKIDKMEHGNRDGFA
ncbi:hypothetical protein [Nocardia camponoti]|uniref:WXG100 family type VII secretion target n=1 Tax=Nocardia camponoti TaxID=1616106 RepID=A0A917QLV2_9NOCA|nr:hypothetical protein [Nocardia camponoti]GGK57595.1 hypothetical protein GCM10011591_32200 [Nocardia camponoti]